MELLDVGTECLGLGENPLTLRRYGLGELLDVDEKLAVHARNDREVLAGPGDRLHLRLVEHQSLDIDGRKRVLVDTGHGRTALPAMVCEQPAASIIAPRTRPAAIWPVRAWRAPSWLRD